MTKRLQVYSHKLTNTLKNYWRAGLSHQIFLVVVSLFLLIGLGMFGIAKWYAWTTRNQPVVFGTSFIPAYASSLGVDPKQTMDGLINEVGIRQFRLVSYWNQIETEPGTYDFSELDWQFQKAEAAHANIILTLGLRQPRWPECHPPSFIDTTKPLNTWQPQLESFISAVVDRYKDSPSLYKYQLENEYFLKGFGDCKDFSRSRLIDEYNLVKKLDSTHPIIVGRSNNAQGFPVGEPTPDQLSISVYKRVWDAAVTKRYLEYPFPAWFYGYLAGVQKLYMGVDMSIAELQAEAWPPNSQPIPNVSLAEQNKSLDATRLKARFEYGKATGMKSVDMWGGEYWYYRKVVLHDDSLWRVATEAVQDANR